MKKKHRILIVDSHISGPSEIESLLTSLDADLSRAETGEQALELAEQNDFGAVVILDLEARMGLNMLRIKLPGASVSANSTSELIAKLHALPSTAEVPVFVVISGSPSEADLRHVYQAGAADVLPRSLAPDLLPVRIKNYLELNELRLARPHVVAAGEQANGGELFRWLSESMEQIAHAMASSLDMAEVPRLVLEQLPEVVPYERGSILLRDGDALWIVAQRGFPRGWPISTARFPIRENDVFQQIVESRQALLIDDVTQTNAWHQASGLPLHRSWLGVPLLSKDQVIGMVSLTRREAGAFQPQEVSLLLASASQAAVALVNARLMNDLTKFNEHLEHLVQQRTEELKNAYEKLEKIDQAKTSFISITAHELRTPLTLIAGYASLLGVLVKESPEADRLVAGILKGEQRLLDMVNDMMDISMIDNQILTVRKSSVNLKLMLKIQREEFESALKERNIQLVVNSLEHLPSIEADTDLLSKLFRQLIGNAIKYTPDGGTITISGSILADSENNGRPSIELQVTDTGIGIDPAYHELIFEKFYQIGPVLQHSSGKTKFKGGGPGLGLTIARGIVQAHDGRIWVESSGYDEINFPGSSFHLVLPQR